MEAILQLTQCQVTSCQSIPNSHLIGRKIRQVNYANKVAVKFYFVREKSFRLFFNRLLPNYLLLKRDCNRQT